MKPREEKTDLARQANNTSSDFYLSSVVMSSYEIEDVIYNPPATIIKWEDGTKTVVRCMEGAPYDKEKGFLHCIAKRHFENTSVNYKKEMIKYGLVDQPEEVSYIDDKYSVFNDKEIVEELKDTIRCFSEMEWKLAFKMMEIDLLIPDEFKKILRMPEYIRLHFDMLPESIRFEKTIKPLLKIMREVRDENKNLGR